MSATHQGIIFHLNLQLLFFTYLPTLKMQAKKKHHNNLVFFCIKLIVSSLHKEFIKIAGFSHTKESLRSNNQVQTKLILH
jgi:hypothetical protein